MQTIILKINVQGIVEVIVHQEENRGASRGSRGGGTWEGFFKLESEPAMVHFKGTWSTVVGMGNISHIVAKCEDPRMSSQRCGGLARLIEQAEGFAIDLSKAFDPA